MGIMEAVCISEEKGTQKVNTHSARFIEDFDIEHDAHASNWHRQVNLIFRERIDTFKERGAQMENRVFSEDLMVEGYDFRALSVGIVFHRNDAVLKTTQTGKECHAHCATYRQVGDYIMPREDVFTAVEHGGVILEGGGLVIVEQPE